MDALKLKVEEALDHIRPYLRKDGGDVEVLEIDERNNLSLKYLGACESCKMNFFTLKTGIEETIREQVPEINEIMAINAIEI